MALRIIIVVVILLGWIDSAARAQSAGNRDEQFFEARIRPVLLESCVKCHGQLKTSHHLRVDSHAALLKGGDGGAAVVPGEPDKSLLIRAIRHTADDLKMPPGKKLPDHVIADFEKWIAAGAVWPATSATLGAKPHWAFQPVGIVEPPPDSAGWSEHPV